MMKKSNRIHQMTASSLLSNVQSNDEHLEANLCTMLQSLPGTKHYWFVRKSELMCTICEYGSPTLFLTFSCAEYESTIIANYLKLNNIPPSYNTGKLCRRICIYLVRVITEHGKYNTNMMIILPW